MLESTEPETHSNQIHYMKLFPKSLRIATLALGITFAGAAVAKAEKYALMVAIEDYSKVGASSLPGCITDQKDLKMILETNFGFPSANITVLSNGEATKAKVLAALDELVSKAKPGDAVVVYYSGHGGQVPDLNDDDETIDNLDEALITVDFNPKDPDTWLLDDHLRASLSRLKTKRALVLLDACHSGTGTRDISIINKRAEFGFEKMLGRGRVDQSPIETGLKADAPSTHVLISGCDATELSAMGEYDGKPRSLFTTALIRTLPRMSTANLRQFNEALHQEMEKIHPEAASRQHPQLETTIDVSIGVMLGEGGGTVVSSSSVVEQPNNEPPLQRPSDGLPSAFPVSLSSDKREYRPGETMVATVVSEKAGYLRLYYVDKEGNATLIFPNYFQQDNQIQGTQRIEVGGTAYPFMFRMKEPGGTELLLAAVSPEQFTDRDALSFSEKNPIVEVGKVTSPRELLDRGCPKEIEVQPRPNAGGGSNQGSSVRPVQIGRAACIYDIKVN